MGKVGERLIRLVSAFLPAGASVGPHSKSDIPCPLRVVLGLDSTGFSYEFAWEFGDFVWPIERGAIASSGQEGSDRFRRKGCFNHDHHLHGRQKDHNPVSR